MNYQIAHYVCGSKPCVTALVDFENGQHMELNDEQILLLAYGGTTSIPFPLSMVPGYPECSIQHIEGKLLNHDDSDTKTTEDSVVAVEPPAPKKATGPKAKLPSNLSSIASPR